MLPTVFGHRGARPEPENTMAAFRHTVSLGVHAIETDFHETRDQVLFGMHDPNVDRTTDGKGSIREKTAQEMRQLRIEGKHEVPDADSILAYAREQGVFVDCEIKCTGNEGVEKRIADKIRQHDMQQNVVITADDPAFLKRMKAELPEAGTGLVMRAKPLYRMAGYLAAGGAVLSGVAAAVLGGPIILAAAGGLLAGAGAGFHFVKRHLQNKGLHQGSDHLMPHWLLVDKRLVQEAAAQGREVVPYGVNGEGRGERLKKLGVYGLISDYPERFNDN